MVHGAGGIHAGLIAGDGLGVAILEDDGQVGEGGVCDAGALGAHGHHLLQQGHHVVGHLIAEGLDLLGTVADAVHPHIGQLAVVLVAQHMGLLVQVLHDLAVQLIQLGAVGVEIPSLGLISGTAHGRVQILFVGAQLGNGELLAVQLHQGTAVDLLVLADQCVELLLQVHGAVVHAQHGILHAGHTGGAEMLRQGVHMGVRQEGPADLYLGIGHGGAVGVKEILFGLPRSVAGVAGVVDIGQLGGGGVVGKSAALLIVHGHQCVAVRGSCGLGGQSFAIGQQGVDVRAGISHFAEFHGNEFLSGSGAPLYISCAHLTTFCPKRKGVCRRRKLYYCAA